MPVYRGNIGNLLQHWVFCEIVQVLHSHAEHLAFIDAYSMAPVANERPRIDDTAHIFDFARAHLADGTSSYERAWHELHLASGGTGYPNSANFLVTLWKKRYSLLLCEIDRVTANELQIWSDRLRSSTRCLSAEVFTGDWRLRFSDGVHSSGDVDLFSFDPYMVSSRKDAKTSKVANIYPEDIDCLTAVAATLPQAVIMQISTYDSNDGNSQERVVTMLHSSAVGSGLEIIDKVRPLRSDGQGPSGKMMSVILARNAPWAKSLAPLEYRFQRWQRGFANGME